MFLIRSHTYTFKGIQYYALEVYLRKGCLLKIFSQNFKFLEMLYRNGIYDKPISSGDHKMLLLAKSQFFKPSKNNYEFISSD